MKHPSDRRQFFITSVFACSIALALLLVGMFLSIRIGPWEVSLQDIGHILSAKILRMDVSSDPALEAIIWLGRVPRTLTGTLVGFSLGAAGAIEAVVCLLAMEQGFLPPTIHHEIPDEVCDLDVVPGRSREAAPNIVLSNSFAFGGNNTCLVLGRWSQSDGAR